MRIILHFYLFLFISISISQVPPASPNGFINPGSPPGVSIDFDCTMREFAYSYGQTIQPRQGSFLSLFDALQLSACNVTRPKQQNVNNYNYHQISDTCTYYIDYDKGNDNNNGTINSPFKTIEKGISYVTSSRSNNNDLCILNLREGVFYLNNGQIKMNSSNSFITIQNYQNENVIISGGIPIEFESGNGWESVQFKPYDWYLYNGYDNVVDRAYSPKHSNDLIKYLGQFANATECLNAIKTSLSTKFGGLHSFTYYDSNYFNSNYRESCYGVKDISWQPVYNQNNVQSGRLIGKNIWKRKVSNAQLFNNMIPGLRINNKFRVIRARFPDHNPEISMQYFGGSGWIQTEYKNINRPNATEWIPSKKYSDPINIIMNANNYSNQDVEWPMKNPLNGENNGDSGFGDWGNFYVGYKGSCVDLELQYGYWCSNKTPRYNTLGVHRHPSGLIYNKTILLPNTPYVNELNDVVLQVWRDFFYYSWMFQVKNNTFYDANKGIFNFNWGGDQGGIGGDVGRLWYIQNIFEELTSPNEYYYNITEHMLYIYYNNTNINNGQNKTAPPNNTIFTVTYNKILFNLTGESQTNPIKNIQFKGIIFQDTMFTYLDKMSIPSAADWALERRAAIMIENAENVVINSSIFTRLDGNGIMLNGYNRNNEISYNNFEWIGGTALILWGHSSGTNLPYTGPDGRNGDQPRYTLIKNNLIREVGIWQKSSLASNEIKSCSNIYDENVYFNGPRCLLNFNDGFGGNTTVQSNLILNSLRESYDGGPHNSFDRMPFITTVSSKDKASIIPSFNQIISNFIIGTYTVTENEGEGYSGNTMDTDDGSAYYNVYSNFFIYGAQGIKQDFNGNNVRFTKNVIAYPSNCVGVRVNGTKDIFKQNRCISNSNNGYNSNCDISGFNVSGNYIYNPSGEINGNNKVCNMTFQQWQSKGNDPGTTFNKIPTSQQIIQWAKDALGVHV